MLQNVNNRKIQILIIIMIISYIRCYNIIIIIIAIDNILYNILYYREFIKCSRFRLKMNFCVENSEFIHQINMQWLCATHRDNNNNNISSL